MAASPRSSERRRDGGDEPHLPAIGWFDRHAFGAVVTADLEKELSAATGRDLSKFFDGFVYGSYHPEVRVTLARAPTGETDIRVEQLQTKGPPDGFSFPLDVDLVDDGGHAERFAVELTGKTTTKRVRTAHAPVSVVVDADEWLVGTVSCGARGPKEIQGSVAECKGGFRCQPGAVSVCVPR